MHARHLEMLSCILGFCNSSRFLLMLHAIDDTLNKETAVVMLPRFMSWKIKVQIAQCHSNSYWQGQSYIQQFSTPVLLSLVLCCDLSSVLLHPTTFYVK